MGHPDGTDDDSVQRFKADLTAQFLRPPDAPERSVRAIAAKFDISTGTAGNLLNPAHPSIPSRETVTAIVSQAAPGRLKSWLSRRDALEVAKRRSGTLEPTSKKPPVRTWWTWWGNSLLGLSVATTLVAAIVLLWPEFPDPGASEPATRVVDGDDPQTAGCLEDAARVRTQPIADLGFVSLVHSARCSAYWARVERVDGAEMSNHMWVSVKEIGSSRNPIVADEANAAIAYTYLLVEAADDGNYCAEARVFVGDSSEQGTACLREP